jgi:hypothetical protein
VEAARSHGHAWMILDLPVLEKPSTSHTRLLIYWYRLEGTGLLFGADLFTKAIPVTLLLTGWMETFLGFLLKKGRYACAYRHV